MEEKAFFTAKEREQLFALYKRLLQLSGDTLQKGDCHKLKIHLIKAVAEGNLPRNCFGMNPIIKDMQTAVIVAEEIDDDFVGLPDYMGAVLHHLPDLLQRRGLGSRLWSEQTTQNGVILFPNSPAPSACAFSLLASAHST